MEQELLTLVDRIYQAATDRTIADTLATNVAHAFDSDSCLLYFRRLLPGQQPVLSSILSGTENLKGEALSAYADYYHERDIWYEHGWRKGIPAIVLSQELVDTPTLMHSEWSDYLKSINTLRMIGVQYHISGDLLGIIGIHRPPDRPEFGENDRRKMALLMPHFQRAMRLREQLAVSEHRGALTMGLLDRLSVAVMLVDAQRRLLFANRCADRMLKQLGALRVTQGMLQPRYARDGKRFAHRIAEATRIGTDLGAHASDIVYLSLPMGKRQPVLIAPLQPADMPIISPLVAVICAEQREKHPVGEDYLISRYGLTRAEARLLSALVAGHSLADYAERTHIAISTVRTYMKRLFSKIGCHRQADIVRTVLSDPMMGLCESRDQLH